MPRRRLHLITLPSLVRAVTRVSRELDGHGLWDERTEAVPVYLTWFGIAYGYCCYGRTGEICIPAVSLLKLRDLIFGSYVTLADVVRHEYGHALAHTHRGLFRSRRFTAVFGASHENVDGFEYDPEFHVSRYAATNASEDFAECFMLYLKHSGRLPKPISTRPIRAKWRFIRDVSVAIRGGKRRWAR
jgi:hypothetical protein